MEQSFRYFVGIDWGTQTHRVAVLGEDGRTIEQYDATHSGEGLVALVNKLKQRTACDPTLVAIGIEVAWGALVETLVEHGFNLFSINPKQVDRFRDRFTVAGAKDDARDALVLATSLRTDRNSYKCVQIDSPEMLRLRELSRFEDELKIEFRRATNRLWQQLHRYYPQMLTISPAADDRFMWDLLSAVPTPAEGARISGLQIQRILKANRIRKLNAEEVLSILKTPPLVLAPGAGQAACEHVLLMLPHVKLLDEQLREVGNRIKCLLNSVIETKTTNDQPPCDADLILSIPGIGPAVENSQRVDVHLHQAHRRKPLHAAGRSNRRFPPPANRRGLRPRRRSRNQPRQLCGQNSRSAPCGCRPPPRPMMPAGSPLRKLLPLATRLKSAATWEQRTFATLRAVCPE